MSELIVDQAMKVFYENSVIPKLEAEVKKLRNCKKYKKLYKNAKELVLDLDKGNYDICYSCMRCLGRRTSVCCKVCLVYICDDCIPNELLTNPCVNHNCSAVIHKKCSDRDQPRVACGHCNNCCDC